MRRVTFQILRKFGWPMSTWPREIVKAYLRFGGGGLGRLPPGDIAGDPDLEVYVRVYQHPCVYPYQGLKYTQQNSVGGIEVE